VPVVGAARGSSWNAFIPDVLERSHEAHRDHAVEYLIAPRSLRKPQASFGGAGLTCTRLHLRDLFRCVVVVFIINT